MLQNWLAQQSDQDLLRFITCGSVDDGKSTLIGRLLWESQQIFEDQLLNLESDSKKYGTQGDAIDFALLVDGLSAEREQGITIDVAYRFFSTTKRKFIVADTPGHEQYTRNMITGASSAHAAILLIDASRGILTQTWRHAYLASLMGIQHIALAINKMDLVNFDQNLFNAIVSRFSKNKCASTFQTITPIPVSALHGDNVTNHSSKNQWYQGPTLMDWLESIRIDRASSLKTVFPVQWVNRPNANFRGYSGTLVSGQLSVGDKLRVSASNQTANLKQIITANTELQTAQAGTAITLVLDCEVDISRGNILTKADNILEITDQFEATLIWLGEEPGFVARNYELKLANQWVNASITNIKYRINVNTQEHEPTTNLSLNDIVVANFALNKSIVMDSFKQLPSLGAFILIDKFTKATVAAGMILNHLRRAQNLHLQKLTITREDREQLNCHRGRVVWFTGLSGSGKSTIANALEKELHMNGRRTYILDGDNIRLGLNKDLGFTIADRVENIRRVAEVAKLMMDAGLVVIAAFISPFRAERQMVRELIGKDNFFEVFVDTPLEVCEKRDPKGLYKKARSGQLPNMTGINSPYEPPQIPDFVVSHSNQKLECVINDLTDLLKL